MKITNVGLGTTSVGPITNTGSVNLLTVERGAIGSALQITVLVILQDCSQVTIILLIVVYILQNLQEEQTILKNTSQFRP